MYYHMYYHYSEPNLHFMSEKGSWRPEGLVLSERSYSYPVKKKCGSL